jgi:hypothetical protein
MADGECIAHKIMSNVVQERPSGTLMTKVIDGITVKELWPILRDVLRRQASLDDPVGFSLSAELAHT